MQLITILLLAVATLTLLTGLAILCGTTKQSRPHGVWFFVATLGAALWSSAIAYFLTMPESSNSILPLLVLGVIAGITLTDVALLGYTSWANGKTGKIATVAFGLIGVVICFLLWKNPELFYTGATYGPEFNTLITTRTWFFYVLIGFFTLISLTYSGFLSKQIKRVKNRGAKNGLRIFQAGLSVGGILALIFDLLLLTSQAQLAWIGPMAVSISIITFYYSVVRYRILTLSGKWMQILSYIILIAAGVVIYFIVFYAVFTSLFRISSPSPQILILNFIMVVIVLCLMPALAEISAMIKSLLPTKQINIGYITKKLNNIDRKNVDLKELAGFLAQHLKLDYFGFLVKGRLYGSKNLDVSSDELVKLSRANLPAHGIWQPLDKDSELDEKILKTAVLFDNKDHAFGQVLIGRSNSGRVLERKDLLEIELAINLCADLLNGGKSL